MWRKIIDQISHEYLKKIFFKINNLQKIEFIKFKSVSMT